MKASAVLSSRSAARRAEDLAYAELRRLEKPVLALVASRLRAEKIRLPAAELEAAYNQAWHGVCQTVSDGQEVRSLKSLLVKITYCRAVDASRRARHETPASTMMLDEYAVDADLVDRVNDQLRLERMIRKVCERLTPRERRAVALCALHGYSRREAAERLGVKEARLHKVMEAAGKKIAGIVAAIDAHGCGDGEWARALRVFALSAEDQAGGPDHLRVIGHIEDCATCRRYVMVLRGLTAILPPPLLRLPLGVGRSSVLARPGPRPRTTSRVSRTLRFTRARRTVAGHAGGSVPASSGSPVAGVFGGGLVKAVVVGVTVVATAAAGGVGVSVMDAHASHALGGRAAMHADLFEPIASSEWASSKPIVHKAKQSGARRIRRARIHSSATVSGEQQQTAGYRPPAPASSTSAAVSGTSATSGGRARPQSRGESQASEFGFERPSGH